MSDEKREHEDDSHEVKRFRREEVEKEQQNESDSDYQLDIPLKERRKEKTVPRMVGGSVNYGNTDPDLNRVSNPALIQTTLHMQKPENQILPGVSNCMPNNPRSSVGLPQMLANTGSPQSTQAILDMLKTFRSPNFPSHHRQHVLAVLKSNPQLMGAFIKRIREKQQHTQQMNERLNMLKQQQAHLVNRMPDLIKDSVSNNPRSSVGLPGMLANTASPQSTQAILDNLLANFKSSNFSPHYKQHVLAVLKSNPQLMGAFIKQRTGRQQQQQMNERRNMLEQQQADLANLVLDLSKLSTNS